MSGSIIEIPRFAGAASLLLTPGLMVVLALPAKTLPPREMLPAAFVLSPAVLASELVMAALAGLPFSLFVPAATVANAVAAALLAWLRPARIALASPLAWILPTVVIAAPLVAVLVLDPFRRVYGWHNMMQLAAILDIYALPRPPEEIELAGFRLAYGWLGWAQVATIAKLTEISPTLVYVPLNILHLAALVYFACEAAVVYSGVRHAMIGVATTFALLCAGLPNILVRLVVWSNVPRGELRITPFQSKFPNMDLMAYAMPAFALASYALVRAARARDLPAVWLMCLSACAASLIYPLFLPSQVIILAVFLAFALAAHGISSWNLPRYRPMELVAIGVACLGSIAVPAAYVWFVSADAATPAASLNLMKVPWDVARLGVVFGIVDGLLLWIALSAWRARDMVALLVVATSAALQLGFVVVEMPESVQYKFLFVALIVSAPIIGANLTVWARRNRLRRVAIVTLFVIAAAGGALAMLSWGWHNPPTDYAEAKILDEATAEPHPIAGWSDSWQSAVRDLTPADAVLLTEPSGQADTIYTMRALFVCSSDEPWRYGYSKSCQGELEAVKRYPAAVIARRKALQENALAANLTEGAAATLLEALAPLGRPIVLHTRAPSAFRTWLETNRIGKSIYASDSDNVWLIDRGVLRPASR